MPALPGTPIAPPANFRATQVRLGERFSYYIDESIGVVKRVARFPSDPTPTTFYLLEPKVQPKRPIRRKRAIRWFRIGLSAVLVLGVGLVAYPYYPSVAYEVQSRVATTTTGQADLTSAPARIGETNQLTIPKIGVNTQILEGSSLDVLNHADGVWHQTGDLQTGNLVLAGHRFKYLPPNTSTLYNLHLLAKGDQIVVDWYKSRYTYRVDLVETIPSTQTKILKQTGGPRLTIYTCTNASETMRTVVLAHRVF